MRHARPSSSPNRSGLATAPVAVLSAFVGADALAASADAESDARQPVPVTAADARAETLDRVIYGTVAPLQSVTVRPCPGGQVMEIPLAEGRTVERGAVILRLDDTHLRADLASAKAKKAQDEAQVANARADVAGYASLAQKGVASTSTLEQEAYNQQLAAAIQYDDAAIKNAETQLGYATVRAPFEGRAGFRQVDVDAVIDANATDGIVTITQMDPIGVSFVAPGDRFGERREAMRQGVAGVEVSTTDGSRTLATSRLTVEPREGVIVPDKALSRGPTRRELRRGALGRRRELGPGAAGSGSGKPGRVTRRPRAAKGTAALLRWLAVCLTLAALLSPARADAPSCGPATPTGGTCACDVRTLHPLQGAIGRAEVRHKAEAIEDKPDRAWRALEKDPIRVVRGPGGTLFVTDHHHGAMAWAQAGRPVALCRIEPRPAFATPQAFWQGLVQDRLVWLEDENGEPLAPDRLPASLAALPDDPYRGLAWRLRKAGGFCRAEMARKEFAEFIWADWLRAQPSLPLDTVRRSAKTATGRALDLARSPAASALPGYVGDKPSSFVCPDD